MTQWLKAQTQARPLGVDREAKVIRGVIVAEEGPFRNKQRGEFDAKGIRTIVKLGNQSKSGLMSRLSHPTSDRDHIFTLLGRVRDFSEDTVMRDGQPRLVARGNLAFGSYAFKTPHGDLASHVMDIVSEDSEGVGMSLNVKPDIAYRMDKRGRRMIDESTGEALSPIWTPLEIDAVDVVGKGEATRSMLAESASPDVVFLESLSQHFAESDRESVREYLTAWTSQALDAHWPKDEDPEPDDLREAYGISTDTLRRRLAMQVRASE